MFIGRSREGRYKKSHLPVNPMIAGKRSGNDTWTEGSCWINSSASVVDSYHLLVVMWVEILRNGEFTRQLGDEK